MLMHAARHPLFAFFFVYRQEEFMCAGQSKHSSALPVLCTSMHVIQYVLAFSLMCKRVCYRVLDHTCLSYTQGTY
jgi:hypothetical protein